MFGTIMGIQRLSSKSLETIRQKQDFINELFGFGVTYKYYNLFLGGVGGQGKGSSKYISLDKRLIVHNRVFGIMFLSAIVYGHLQT